MNVLIISPNNFPNGDAGALRDLSFAKIYMELGYTVSCICNNTQHTEGEYQGIKYRSLYLTKNNKWQKIKNYISYKDRFKEVLHEIESKTGKPDVIHIYDIPSSAIKYLIRYARKNNVTLIHDSVEWYSPCEFKMGRFDKAYILKDRLNRFLIKQPIKVIAISKYLEKHFNSKNLTTVRIPVILDVKEITPKSEVQREKLQIVYAGSPAKKDYLKEVIEGVYLLPKELRDKIMFHIIGVNEQQLVTMCGCDKTMVASLTNCIKPYGRLPREEVLSILKEMDFSVLLRPPTERYAMAGFPTKVVEGLSNSIPMMCNITSDLGDYLHDQENAIIVDDCSSQAIRMALEKALSCSESDLMHMKQAARRTAEQYFDYRVYITSVAQILKSEIGSNSKK
ncbi:MULTISPECIES: glycosyltransferase [Bacillus cereus group]|uniref:glycosyltransferase n=1 Tax=Bacillus cereus group TaxID=86661 RepID=UPI000BF5C41D|nr:MULTISPECIES: glycosyltransferase [Bacillus cereus group]PFB22164.1 hypothetical protein CN408_06480 [Bacillus cereus]PGA28951.1 hypothetical protein COL80_04590 [Bacillus thuringiensis]